MTSGIKYEFRAKPWLHEWLFVAMPVDMATEIRRYAIHASWQALRNRIAKLEALMR